MTALDERPAETAAADGAWSFPEDEREHRAQLAEAYDTGRAEGYAAGHADGLDARPPRDVWVPLPFRWRQIVTGDVVTGADGTLWRVSDSSLRRDGRWRLAMVSPSGVEGAYDGDPDEQADVLCPVPEVDAMRLVRDELGARVIEGRRKVSER